MSSAGMPEGVVGICQLPPGHDGPHSNVRRKRPTLAARLAAVEAERDDALARLANPAQLWSLAMLDLRDRVSKRGIPQKYASRVYFELTVTANPFSDAPARDKGDAMTWRHARWIEPHEGVPVEGSIRPIRAHGGRLGAECATCHEVLIPARDESEGAS